jgi:uncharacterized membrane protein
MEYKEATIQAQTKNRTSRSVAIVPTSDNGPPRSVYHRSRYLPWIVAAAFTVSGVVHLCHPSTFTSSVPHFLPLRTGLVYASGVAELICAVGLWRRDRWAGTAAAVLLVVIWPANLQDAISAQYGHDLTTQVLDWVRFPLQIPLIWFALQSGRRRTGTVRSG